MKQYTVKEIDRGARIYVIRSIIAPLLMAFLYFVAAGNLHNTYAWIYFIVFFLLSFTTNGVFYVKQKEFLFHRNRIKSDAKGWDKILMPVAVFSGFHLQSIVMGLDDRFRWSNQDHTYAIVGLVIYLLSFLLTVWAMFVNPHFEANVRIQHDRVHQVISKGPYGFVRHPGYLSFILATFSVPLIVGTFFGFINAAFASIMILIRTGIEDRTLLNELEGYANYAKKVKFRILPRIW